ncbi:Hypothetical predicted protein [Mytilus galloprovincialis]|uniref:Uncharacterized protein n=1 Tax=Mytilus galloprovincialis TaxID=29158 RepID=A0A8B6GKW5_MYTGA|nr:Hypothetical predicted protein [Mytilus galloprovincialis]
MLNDHFSQCMLKDKPENVEHLYVMIDDQSNRTLASPQLFDMLTVGGDETKSTLYAQKLRLEWCIIVENCQGSVHIPKELRVNKTNILENGRRTLFDPCNNQIKLKEIVHDVFEKTNDDDKPGLAIEDRLFFNMMDSAKTKTEIRGIRCPLGTTGLNFFNNYKQVLRRAIVLDNCLTKRLNVERTFSIVHGGDVVKQSCRKSNDRKHWYLHIFPPED